ncbi:Uncharacterised protein [Stenotrophomonas maltophilia]|nr:Uncharacterised protein [Stenotrophomonas maltophilia]
MPPCGRRRWRKPPLPRQCRNARPRAGRFCMRARIGGAGYDSARVISATAEGCHFLCSCKESNQRNTPPGREPSLRDGSLRFSANQGAAPNSLRSNIGASSPLIPLRCSARSRRTQGQMLQLHPVDSRHAWMLLLLILTFQSAFKRAEHRRSGEGEEVRVSERSEFPRRPSTGRGAQGTGVRSTSARGRRSVSLVTFLMAHIHVHHPTGRLRRSTLLLQRGARAKKVTPLCGRGNDPQASPGAPMRRRTNENGTLAGAVPMNRFTRNLRTSRRTPPRSRCSPAPSAATRPPSGCRPRSDGCPDRGCPSGPGSRP